MPETPIAPPPTWVGELRALLGDPIPALSGETPAASIRRRAAIALMSLAVYGGAAGLFQGGTQTLESALKAPLVVVLSVALCAPSLLVFSSLAGLVWDGRRLSAVLVSFCALAGLVLLGLLPVVWLFSVSSRYLGFVTIVHTGCWSIAIALAGRFLARTLRREGASGAPLWAMLLFIVSLQAATVLRPMLWREPGEGWRATEKLFFLEHFIDSADRHQGEAKEKDRD